MIVKINGLPYMVQHVDGRAFVSMAIEHVEREMVLDMGAYVARHVVDGNPDVWDVELEDGTRYTETRFAHVRVWL